MVNHRYLLRHRELLQSLKGEGLILAGDGRCDCPGHNAKYSTYSIMHVATEKIPDFSLVQVSEVNNSNCMEKEWLKYCLENPESDGQIIDILATDTKRLACSFTHVIKGRLPLYHSITVPLQLQFSLPLTMAILLDFTSSWM